MTSDCNALSLVNCASVSSNGDDQFCNCNTCSENEGDCDYNYQCQDGLVCGSNNCFDSKVDCCYKPTEIISPNFPNSYPHYADETWLLTAATGSFITLQFHSFHVRHIVESKSRTKYEINISTD